jgi:DNA-binding MarR family transcriptional regulator
MTPTHLMLALLASMVGRDLRAPAVQELIKLGLLTHEPWDDHGKRRERVVVTPTGEAVVREMAAVFEEKA